MPGHARRQHRHAGRRQVEPRLVAQPAEPRHPPPALAAVHSPGRGVRLRGGVQEARPRGAQEGSLHADDDVAGVVAGRLRALRAALHPHGVAQRRHLPHRRRPRRRLRGHPALRAPQQLARQRQPRQGAPAALADQAEVRQQDLLGRPHDLRRQLRHRVDGAQALRLRRRPRGRLRARGGHLLGRRGGVARRQALRRRPGTRKPACRGADGAHLREPGRAERQPGSPRLRPGHPRDLRPHGHERRGDRRAHRRRPHLRQDPRRGRPDAGGSGARGRPDRGAGPRLEEQLRHRQGRRHDHQRAGRRLDAEPGQVGQRLLRHAARLRVGADEEPGRRAAVEAEGSRGGDAGAGRARLRRSGTRR